MNLIPEAIHDHWSVVRPIFSIHNEDEYDLAIERLNALLDEIGDNEDHPLYELMDTLSTVIHAYEETHHPLPDSDGIGVLRFLMDEHGLTPSDIPEIGPADFVSDILSGKRELSASEIRVLAKRFHVSPEAII